MILSEKSIKRMLKSGKMRIEPLDDDQIQPASVDLRIAGEILLIKGEIIDFESQQRYEKISGEQIIFPPKTHALVRTIEWLELPNNVAGMNKLKSSISRIGLIFNNAGWVDPGFKGTLTMSVFNANEFPVKMKPGTRFSQLVLMKLDRESEGYSGKYIGQNEVTGKMP